MAKLPRDAVKQYFPFYPDRWLTSRRLRVCSPAARGVLIDLMAMAWEDGGKVCEELDVLAPSMGLSPEALQGLLDELVRRDRITITNRKGLPPTIHVPPLEAIHAEAVAYIEARQADGKRGADARYKGAHRDPIGCLQGAYPLTGPELTGTDRTGSDQIIPEEKKGKGTTPAPRFVPPTVAEVSSYVQEKGYHFEPAEFMAYYETRNWIPNGAKRQMTSWRSACTTWEGNWKRNNTPARAPQRSPSNAAHGSDPHKYDHLIVRSEPHD